MESKFEKVKPPIGLIPKKYFEKQTNANRLNQVSEAIARYFSAGLKINVVRSFVNVKLNRKDVENSETLKIFIVLCWFWDGDGYLTNEYKDCFLAEQDAVSFANTFNYGGKTIKIYLPGESIPNESDGGYRTPAFAQIVEKVF